jgi:hypothetical protein
MGRFRLRLIVTVFLTGLIPAAAQLVNPTQDPAGSDGQPSIADQARRVRKDTSNEVKMTDSDAKKLFESVDKIFDFAAEDSGMPKHVIVKRRLVSKEDVEKYTSGKLGKEEYTQRFAQSELSMKKLGFLPRDFNLRDFLVKSNGQNIAGYYDPESKTISLLNWIPADRQRPILAHELTHALQDQNYDLQKWMKIPENAGEGNDDAANARRAVVEGQAMVVYVDYLIAPYGRNLTDTPGLIYSMEEPAVRAVIDSQTMHDAPMILRESGTFAYNEGLIFEGELLHKGGKKMAFSGAFARPPRNSHEVLQPEAYINGENLPPVRIPDMKDVLSGKYDIYDFGGIGQLDVRALLKQYGERRNADELSSEWQGGVYVTYRRSDKPAEGATTPDLALLYVSQWRSPRAAERFARFYASAVSQRYRHASPEPIPVCSGDACPKSTVQISTEEGPVIIQQWPDNTVLVSESFDAATANKLSSAIRDGIPGMHAQNLIQGNDEINTRLMQIPAFQEFADRIGQQIRQYLRAEAHP